MVTTCHVLITTWSRLGREPVTVGHGFCLDYTRAWALQGRCICRIIFVGCFFVHSGERHVVHLVDPSVVRSLLPGKGCDGGNGRRWRRRRDSCWHVGGDRSEFVGGLPPSIGGRSLSRALHFSSFDARGVYSLHVVHCSLDGLCTYPMWKRPVLVMALDPVAVLSATGRDIGRVCVVLPQCGRVSPAVL